MDPIQSSDMSQKSADIPEDVPADARNMPAMLLPSAEEWVDEEAGQPAVAQSNAPLPITVSIWHPGARRL